MNLFLRLFSRCLFGLILLMSVEGWSGLSANLFLNYEETNIFKAGEPVQLILEIFDVLKADPVHHFHLMHEKPLHLIIVSEDLLTFSHLHPTQLREHMGLFGIEINKQSKDPYNLDAASTALLSGNYFLFAESMPMGYSMSTLPLQMAATGASRVMVPLIPDVLDGNGVVTKDYEGYRLLVKPATYAHCGSFSVFLEVQILEQSLQSGVFNEVKDLQTWLGAFGHTVLVSEQGVLASEKSFIHLHTVWPLSDDPKSERGPYLRITTDSHGAMVPGRYKTWLQFKHRDKVVTVPFVFDLKKPSGLGISSEQIQQNSALCF